MPDTAGVFPSINNDLPGSPTHATPKINRHDIYELFDCLWNLTVEHHPASIILGSSKKVTTVRILKLKNILDFGGSTSPLGNLNNANLWLCAWYLRRKGFISTMWCEFRVPVWLIDEVRRMYVLVSNHLPGWRFVWKWKVWESEDYARARATPFFLGVEDFYFLV